MMIGDVARLSETKVPTVRFYEQIGLLRPAARTDSGRRTYGAADLRRLSFIRHARALGFAIEDIRALLDLADQPQRPCAEADEIARTQLDAVQRKIKQLEALRGELRRVADACAGGTSRDCRVIEALADRSLCGDAHVAPDE